jgi:hypothetical protein
MYIAQSVALMMISTLHVLPAHVRGHLHLRVAALLGVQVDVFITPDGRVIKITQLAGVVQCQVPQRLVDHWNG